MVLLEITSLSRPKIPSIMPWEYMQAAGLNVKVNTRLMADKAHADALEARAEQLLAEFVPQADRVYQTVSNE